jgi:hypothetical protein
MLEFTHTMCSGVCTQLFAESAHQFFAGKRILPGLCLNDITEQITQKMNYR